jgi:hypothetical protein
VVLVLVIVTAGCGSVSIHDEGTWTFVDRLFASGGWTILVLLLSLIHWIPVIAQIFVCKKYDFSSYLWAAVAGIVLVGGIGSMVGVLQAFSALGMASAEDPYGLLARGISVALTPVLLAILLSLPGVFFTGIASTLARNFGPRRRLFDQGGEA